MALCFRFAGVELDPAARLLRNDRGPVHVEQQVFGVLMYLLEHRHRAVPKAELLDAVWGHRFVTESALTSRIKSARRAVGDSGDRQAVIRTVRGIGYQLTAPVEVIEAAPAGAGPVPVPVAASAAQAPAAPAEGPTAGPDEAEATVRFVPVEGGASLAVAESGQGPCLVKTATWLTQVDRDTGQSPVWGHWIRALSRRYTYVRYDPRGCGLSDRDLHGVDLTDLDLWVDDLSRVVDAVGHERVALLGVSQGGPVAIAYAVRHPERVSHLVLYGTYARGMRRRGDPLQQAEAELQVDLARIGWATTNASFRETFARQFVPDAQADEINWFNDQLTTTTTAANAPRLEEAFHHLDVTELARAVTVPTLVMHPTGDRAVAFEEGRLLAGLIPGARFVPLDSRNHILLQRDAAFARFVDEIERFLAT